MRLAFMGFRHGHIMPLYHAAARDPRIEVVAACEEHAPTADSVASGGVTITHRSFDQMLREVRFDPLAVGDSFGRRGAVIIAALEAGKHVISDKPICTALAELERIEQLAGERRRSVGCLFD